jgi:hypothetical protein
MPRLHPCAARGTGTPLRLPKAQQTGDGGYAGQDEITYDSMPLRRSPRPIASPPRRTLWRDNLDEKRWRHSEREAAVGSETAIVLINELCTDFVVGKF